VSYLLGAGMLDFAYIYGYDEVTTQADFDKICSKFGQIHSTYPGLRTMTTAAITRFAPAPPRPACGGGGHVVRADTLL